ncbi:hypothetical protein B0H13DRAFT_1861920 [Mycena leptocephala]|nr:hypothetical protein B0H13DRAFT_1861920 [Mycena leptocephala]
MVNPTLELVNVETGFSTSPQSLATVDNVTSNPGTWKMRMNFTGTGPWSTEKVSALSDELFVAQQSPCVGLTQSSTSSSIATQSTPATGISQPTLPTSSAAPSKTPSSTPYPSNARRVMRFSSPPTGHYDLILPIVSYPDDISDGGIEF